jgi:hypothetical protein
MRSQAVNAETVGDTLLFRSSAVACSPADSSCIVPGGTMINCGTDAWVTGV